MSKIQSTGHRDSVQPLAGPRFTQLRHRAQPEPQYVQLVPPPQGAQRCWGGMAARLATQQPQQYLPAVAARRSPAAWAPQEVCPAPTIGDRTYTGRVRSQADGLGLQVDRECLRTGWVGKARITGWDPGAVTAWCQGWGRAVTCCLQGPAIGTSSTGRGTQGADSGPSQAPTPCCHCPNILDLATDAVPCSPMVPSSPPGCTPCMYRSQLFSMEIMEL